MSLIAVAVRRRRRRPRRCRRRRRHRRHRRRKRQETSDHQNSKSDLILDFWSEFQIPDSISDLSCDSDDDV